MSEDEMNMPDKPPTAAQAERLTATSEPWLSCDECFDHIDSCVSALLQDGRALDEPMWVHLAGCPACCEEAESLISLAAADEGVSPGQVINAFRADLGLPVNAQPKRRSGIARLFRRYRNEGRGSPRLYGRR